MLLASTMPAARPAPSEMALLMMDDSMSSAANASSRISPPAVRLDPLTSSSICAGCSSPMSDPSSASIAFSRTFCDFQPIVLNASVRPIAQPSACAFA